jgi:hypothetical protein
MNPWQVRHKIPATRTHNSFSLQAGWLATDDLKRLEAKLPKDGSNDAASADGLRGSFSGHSAEALFRKFTACLDEKNPGKLVTPTTDWKRVLIR